MRNQGCSGGCLTFVAGIVIIGLALLAVKWFGIPVGLALAVFSFTQFKRSESDVEDFEKTAERLGMQSEHLRWGFIAGMVIGALLVISSIILWFVPNDDTSTSGVAGTPSAESRMIDVCTDAVSVSTNDPYGAGAAMNGRYENATTTANGDGTTTVHLERSRESGGGRCPTRLVGSCVMRGPAVVSKSELRQDGYIGC